MMIIVRIKLFRLIGRFVFIILVGNLAREDRKVLTNFWVRFNFFLRGIYFCCFVVDLGIEIGCYGINLGIFLLFVLIG